MLPAPVCLFLKTVYKNKIITSYSIKKGGLIMQYLPFIKSVINTFKKCIYKIPNKHDIKTWFIKCIYKFFYKNGLKKPFIKIPYKIR